VRWCGGLGIALITIGFLLQLLAKFSQYNRLTAAPTPCGFAQIISDYLPILHARQILSLLLSPWQSETSELASHNH
jgi:hypothetical protein